jgi:L-ascorbate metabolism protein UlaG (beta-lactamase superfamily)
MRAMRHIAWSLWLLPLLACDRQPSSSAAPAATPATAIATTNAAPAPSAAAPSESATDTIPTSARPLVVTPVHHATLLLGFAGKTIALDPWNDGLKPGLPKADYVFVSDIHQDHLDPKGIEAIAKPDTILVGPPAVDEKRKMNVVLKNGESHDFGAFKVEAVPMYNEKRGPGPGKLFHDKGRGNGYVFTFGDARVYVSGDTECTPEMKALKDIKVAFVCMNLPYTMPPDEAAECVRTFKPKIVYPYHYREQDLAGFKSSVEAAGTEVRLRDWYGTGPGRPQAAK